MMLSTAFGSAFGDTTVLPISPAAAFPARHSRFQYTAYREDVTEPVPPSKIAGVPTAPPSSQLSEDAAGGE